MRRHSKNKKKEAFRLFPNKVYKSLALSPEILHFPSNLENGMGTFFHVVMISLSSLLPKTKLDREKEEEEEERKHKRRWKSFEKCQVFFFFHFQAFSFPHVDILLSHMTSHNILLTFCCCYFNQTFLFFLFHL